MRLLRKVYNFKRKTLLFAGFFFVFVLYFVSSMLAISIKTPPVSEDITLPVGADEPVSPDITPPVGADEPVSPDITLPVGADEPVSPDITPPVGADEPVSPDITLPLSADEPVSPDITLPVGAATCRPLETEVISPDITLPISADEPVSPDITLPISADEPVSPDIVLPISADEPVSPDITLPISADEPVSPDITGAATSRPSYTDAELRQMSAFITNFTELGLLEFDINNIENEETFADLIRFSISRVYINNPKRVAKCRVRNCPWGSLTIRGSYVAEAIKRYFGLDVNLASATKSGTTYHYDGRSYHFDVIDGDAKFNARVDEAFVGESGNIVMTGALYDARNRDDIRGKFEATAKPHIYNKRRTWALISINAEYRAEPTSADMTMQEIEQLLRSLDAATIVGAATSRPFETEVISPDTTPPVSEDIVGAATSRPLETEVISQDSIQPISADRTITEIEGLLRSLDAATTVGAATSRPLETEVISPDTTPPVSEDIVGATSRPLETEVISPDTTPPASEDIVEAATSRPLETEVISPDTTPPASDDKTKIFNAEELKQMGGFLSNFTKLGLMEFDINDVTNEETFADLIRFGVWHNYVNNPKRIVKCKVRNCEWGSETISGKVVTDTIREYFGVDYNKLTSAAKFETPYYFDGKSYHFEGLIGENIFYARADEATQYENDKIIIKGVLYNSTNEDDILGNFEAEVKPHRYGRRRTWALISMKTEY